MWTVLALVLAADPASGGGTCIDLKMAGTCMEVQPGVDDAKKYCERLGFPWSAEPCPADELGHCQLVDDEKKPFVKHFYKSDNYPDVASAKRSCKMRSGKWVAPKAANKKK